MVEHKVYIASAARNLYALGDGRHKAQRAILHALLRHVDGRFHKWQQAFHNVAQHTACKVVGAAQVRLELGHGSGRF